MNREKLLKFETIERWLKNDEPEVFAEVGSAVVYLRGEFDLEQVRSIYEWLKRNYKIKDNIS